MNTEIIIGNLSYNPTTGMFKRLFNHGRFRICKSLDSRGYLRIKIDGKEYRAHRLAWLFVNGEFPLGNLDHINGIKTDNRFCNLRIASVAENSWNVGKRPHNTSGHKNIRPVTVNGYNYYVVQITRKGNKISKSFTQDDDGLISAQQWRNKIINEYSGEYINYGEQ